MISRTRFSGTTWIVGGILVLTAVVYAQMAGHGFVNYDDNLYITSNATVQSGLSWESLGWAFRTQATANWHPVTWISLLVDVELFGLRPGLHHLMALAFHLANTLLLFLVLRRCTGDAGPSAFVAALFALHPLHVESVAWASERKDVLSTLFWMLTLLAYVRYTERPGWGRYVWVVVFLALGLLAKPMLVTLPFVLLLFDIWPLGRWRPWKKAGSAGTGRRKKREKPLEDSQDAAIAPRRILVEKLPLLALVLILSIVVYLVQREQGAMQFSATFPLGLRIQNALLSWVAYLGKTVWPVHLAILYPHRAMTPAWRVGTLPGWQVALAVALLAAITVWVVRDRGRRPYLLVGWLWYLGTLFPVIGVVQVGTQAMADRYTYVPLIGIFIMVAWGMGDLWKRRRWSRAVLVSMGVVLVVACAGITGLQLRHWKSSVTLFSRAVASTGANPVARFNLGLALNEEGKTAQALPHFTEAVRIAPTYGDAHVSRVHALETLGRKEEAVQVQLERAAYLTQQRRGTEAIQCLQDALRIAPGDPRVQAALAAATGKAPGS